MPDRPIRVLLVEDEPLEIQAMREYLAEQTDIKLVGWSDNNKTAMELVCDEKPDIVIADFMLKGASLGSDLVVNIRTADLSVQPFIIVVSCAMESWKREQLLSLGANEVMIKGSIVDTPIVIVSYIRNFFQAYLEKSNQSLLLKTNVMPISEQKNRLLSVIKTDLERLGITSRRLGFHYLVYAISSRVISKQKMPLIKDIYAELAFKERKNKDSVEHAIRDSIDKAFLSSTLEDIRKIYTPKYDESRGKPTNGDFITFFVNKYINDGYGDIS